MRHRGPERAGASALEAELRALHERIKDRFVRPVAWERALTYLRGLLAPVERKNGWQLAEYAGDARPDGVQRLLSTYRWDEDGVRDDLREYVVEHLGDERGVLVVAETGFLKQGKKSAGVERQYNRTAGMVENCQVGLFLAYVSRGIPTFLDRELYISNDWEFDLERREEAGVPDELPGFRTKAGLATAMIGRVLAAEVPFAWVASDAEHCHGYSMRWLEEQRVAYVLPVEGEEAFPTRGEGDREWVTARRLAEQIPPAQWRRFACGTGGQLLRYDDWARVSLGHYPILEKWRWLLVRRGITDPNDFGYYACFSHTDVSLGELARVANHGRIIDDTVQRARREVGLDHYEVRRWTGWYRHVTLALAAHACAAVARHAAVRHVSKGDRRRSSY